MLNMRGSIFLFAFLCFIYKIIQLYSLHWHLEEFRAHIIKVTRSKSLYDCPALDFYESLRQAYRIPDCVILYLADNPDGEDRYPTAFAFQNLFLRKSSIFIYREFTEYLYEISIKFVIAHEVGHVLDRKNNMLHFFLFPKYEQIDKRDLLADAFASRIVGRWNGILALEEVDELCGGKAHQTSMRIMALCMPTLFYKYA
jgi:hypothetical protein